MLSYELIRCDRRSIAAMIRPDGRLVVRAPGWVAQKEIDRFLAAHEDRLLAGIAKAKARALLHPEPDAGEWKRLREEARLLIPARVDYYAGILGVRPTAVRINAAKRRFGSCSSQNSLNFSCLLMRYPLEAIDYVVVHELCHILHHDHSPAFYASVASILPDYQKREALLRE